MTCRDFADFMLDYLSGDLPGDVRARFEHHLERCSNCRMYLEIYADTVRLGRRAFDDEAASLPDELPDDLVRAIVAARSARGPGRGAS